MSAKSWYLDELWELSQHGDVEAVVVHMCCVALTAEDSAGTGLEKNPTKVLTSLPSIASAIDRQCEGGHRHVRLTSGRAQAAAEYTQEFCNAIVTGVDIYNQHLGEALTGHYFLVEEGELMNRGSDMCDPSEELPFTFNDWGYCVDDVKGGLLPMDLVREARRSETEGFAQRRVYGIRPRWECEQEGGKVVGVRWVGVAKNDGVRRRLVCTDFNKDRQHSDEMFAPTTLLPASRWLVSLMASQGVHGPGQKHLMAVDFSKVFLYGDMQHRVFI